MFFILSKVFWLVFTPSTLFALSWLILGLWSLLRGKAVPRRTGIFLVIMTLALLVLPVGDWVLAPWEQKVERVDVPRHVTGVVVLGGMINATLTDDHNQVSLSDNVERLTAVISLAYRYPQSRLIFSGGSGDMFHPDRSEAIDARRLLREWHVSMSEMNFEGKSRNTYENAVFSKKIARPKTNETWLLVTSAYHMPRAMAVFDKQGWGVVPYPVDFRARKNASPWCFCMGRNFEDIDLLVHELVGWLSYRITGKA